MAKGTRPRADGIQGRTCANCAFADPRMEEGEPVLQCRRYPPAVLVYDGEAVKVFPGVEESDWCGEWRAPVVRG